MKQNTIDLPRVQDIGDGYILERIMAPLKGGDPSLVVAAEQQPVAYPLGGPEFSGNRITVDALLNRPTMVTRAIRDMSIQKFLADYFFAAAGGVVGGAVLFEEAEANDFYLTRDVQGISPGGDFPLVTSERSTPKVAPVEKWGGKFYYTDEARDRQDQASFRQQTVKLANTIVRKNNQRAMEQVETVIEAKNQKFVGNNWAAYQPAGTSPTLPANSPWADIAKAQMLADQLEMGVNYTDLLLNPIQATVLRNAKVSADDLGINSIFVSNRVPAGKGYMVERGAVGGLKVEDPLRTVTWREEEKERTWVKSGVRNVMYVTNSFAMVRIDGLAG